MQPKLLCQCQTSTLINWGPEYTYRKASPVTVARDCLCMCSLTHTVKLGPIGWVATWPNCEPPSKILNVGQ